MYSYNSIKGTCSIKRPGLEFFKKSLLNDQYDLKNKGLNTVNRTVSIKRTGRKLVKIYLSKLRLKKLNM